MTKHEIKHEANDYLMEKEDTPLIAAVRSLKPENVRNLLAREGNRSINDKNGFGYTAIEIATKMYENWSFMSAWDEARSSSEHKIEDAEIIESSLQISHILAANGASLDGVSEEMTADLVKYKAGLKDGGSVRGTSKAGKADEGEISGAEVASAPATPGATPAPSGGAGGGFFGRMFRGR